MTAGVPRRRALVVGVTGISGGNLAQRLLADGWEVAGLCRRPQGLDGGITPLGLPTEDPHTTSTGRGATFEKGGIYQPKGGKAHALWGVVWDAWVRNGKQDNA